MEKALLETGLILREFKRGKVRDVYELLILPGSPLLMIATDRISAFDIVMKQGVPGKGKVLTQLSKFWFRFFEEEKVIKTHFLSDRLPRGIMGVVFYDGRPFRVCQEIKEEERKDLAQRVMVVQKTKIIPLEFVVRGYLYGLAWEDYQPGKGFAQAWKGLSLAEKLPLPTVTLTTKASEGHDAASEI